MKTSKRLLGKMDCVPRLEAMNFTGEDGMRVTEMDKQRVRWALIGLALLGELLSVLLGMSKQASAQGGGWSKPVMLSTNTVSSWWPDVTVDDYGRAYVVWNSGRLVDDEPQDLLLYSAWDGQKWSEARDIVLTARGGYTIRPAIAVSKDNTLHVTYRGYSVIYYTQSPAYSAENAASWANPHRISRSQAAYYSDIAVDSRGHIHVVWSEQVMLEDNTVCPNCSDIFYRHSTDGGRTWSPPIDLSESDFGSVKPQIKIDRHDGIHVVWEEGEDWYVNEGYPVACAYVHSLDGGSMWSEPTFFSSVWGPPQQITLGFGKESELVVVWRVPADSTLFYQHSMDNGASWSPPLPIPGIVAKDWEDFSLDSCDTATDSGGNVHLVVLGRLSPSEESLSILHLVWSGTNWLSPVRVFTSLDPPEWPRIAVGGGNKIHATWFTRDREHIDDTENAQYQVWCASSQSASPAQTPVPLPTSTPTPLLSPLVTATPTATPFPTLAPGGTALPDGLYTENDDILRLLVGLTPVLILIAIILVIKGDWLRRLSQ